MSPPPLILVKIVANKLKIVLKRSQKTMMTLVDTQNAKILKMLLKIRWFVYINTWNQMSLMKILLFSNAPSEAINPFLHRGGVTMYHPLGIFFITQKVRRISSSFFLTFNKIGLGIFCQKIKVTGLTLAFLQPFLSPDLKRTVSR